MPNGGPRIPAAPFVAWLQEQLETLRRDETIALRDVQLQNPPVNTALARRLGISRRRLCDYLTSRNGSGAHTDTFGRWSVEDMLENAGHMFGDVYPDLAPEDIELEPDTHCPRCSDIVTPIEGVCPWCETRLAQWLEAA